MKRGHVPLRTCIECSRRFPKTSLLRLRVGPGGVVIGDGPGRGYYVCKDPRCLSNLLSSRNLARFLGRPITEEEMRRVSEGMLERTEDSARPKGFPGSEDRR